METVVTILNAGLLRDTYPLKATGERSNYKDLSAIDMAKKLRLTRVVDEITKCKDIEDSLSWMDRMARIGDVDRMTAIFAKHPDLLEKEASVDKTTPLYWAVTSGNLAAVKYLVDAGADVFVRAGNGDTLLTRAVILGHTHLITYLVRTCGLDPDMTGSDNKSPIHRAMEYKDQDLVKDLISVGASVLDSSFPQLAISGDVDLFRYIIQHFTLDVNYQDRKGKSPLYYALEYGHLDFAKLLIDKGADIQLIDKRTRCVFHAVIEGGSAELMQIIIDKCCKLGVLNNLINQHDRYLGSDRCFLVRGRDNGLLAFHYVEVDRYFLHVFREITKSGGSLDVAQFGTVIKSGWGAHPATEIVKEIDGRYDVSQVVSDTPADMTPLCLAILKEKDDLAIMLIDEGCDINQTDNFGLTPLHLAAMRGLVNVVAKLDQKGVQLDVLDQHDRTAIKCAEANGHTRVVNFIKAREFYQQYDDKLTVSIREVAKF